jgi:hypothetical protein
MFTSSGHRHRAPRLPESKAKADKSKQHHRPGSGLGDRSGERKYFCEKVVTDDVVGNVRRMDNKVIEVLIGIRAGCPCCEVKTRVGLLVMLNFVGFSRMLS